MIHEEGSSYKIFSMQQSDSTKIHTQIKVTILISNYRPISLLSNLNKIFEKFANKRIYAFLEK